MPLLLSFLQSVTKEVYFFFCHLMPSALRFNNEKFFIKGEKNWQAENPDGLYDADPNKGRSFIESIEQKQYLNLIQDGCDSTLTALLGREAAFTGKRVFWDELIRENKRLDTGIDLLNIK